MCSQNLVTSVTGCSGCMCLIGGRVLTELTVTSVTGCSGCMCLMVVVCSQNLHQSLVVEWVHVFDGARVLTEPSPSKHVQVLALYQVLNSL